MSADFFLAALTVAVVLLAGLSGAAVREIRITRRERLDMRLEREQLRLQRQHSDELALRRLKSLLEEVLPPSAPAIPLGSDEPTVAEGKAPR